ncbi:aminotransferase class IV [Rugosibacter aromaticivorans]|uniref:aminotransferase class IV n=1 Tax=Rugosibacter aromaticivorans TaxID=1565605 RepID=UPI000B29B386|nr:aminotransferase class IV [Rugosibacter aromaticivorans]
MSTQLYLNGQWLAPEDAQVSVMDRGFLFGDGVYEVIPVYSRHPFRLDQHLGRLGRSLDAIQIGNPHTQAEWTALVSHLAATAEWDDHSIYIQVTRGPMAVRNHVFPAEPVLTVLLLAEQMNAPSTEQVSAGVAAVSAADIRWLRCDIKSTSLLANCLLRQQAVAAGCAETVLFRDGFLTEGAAASIFVVRNGVLLAPIKNHLTLPGITYDVVLELAAANGLPVSVRDITEAETRTADELWLASSTREVLPIVQLDGVKVGRKRGCVEHCSAPLEPAGDATPAVEGMATGNTWAGTPGPVFAAMYGWYQEYKTRVMRHG